MVTLFVYYILQLQLAIPDEIRFTRLVDFIFGVMGYDKEDVFKATEIMKVALDFKSFRSKTSKVLPYTGQIMSLEALLSQDSGEFPVADITIEDAVRLSPAYLHNEGEPFDPVYLTNVGEPDEEAFYVSNKQEYEAEVDFIVRVGLVSVSEDHKKYIASIVDQFVVAGKTYKILAQNE